MTLKQLEAFYWAASCRNFALAAARLNISVSSLSKRITELEHVVGAPLFNREGRSATLSPLGEHMLEEASDLLRRADAFLAMAAERRSASGRCRLGVGELTALTWLAPLIARVQQEAPGLVIAPHVNLGDALQRKLADGELDCAIVADASTSAAIASHVIGQGRFSWVAAPIIAQRHKRWRAADIVAETVICLSAGAGTTRLLDKWLNANEVARARQLTCESLGAVAALLQQGLGAGFLPSAWADVLVRNGRLAPLKGAPALAALSYAFQWRRDDHRPMLAELRAIAQNTIEFHAPPGLSV